MFFRDLHLSNNGTLIAYVWGQTLADELMNDFSDNDETPLTEPIYNGR